MKTKTVTLFAAFAVMAFALGSQAAVGKKKANQPKLATSHNFEGLDATGKYLAPLGATASVESDKNTLNLIDFRTHYRDRAQQALSGR